MCLVEVDGAEATVVVHFPNIRGIPAAVVRIPLGTLALHADVNSQECKIHSDAVGADPHSLKASVDGQPLPIRVRADRTLELVLPETVSRYGVVSPGPFGPITSCRWESVRETAIDLEYLANIDYLLERYCNVLPKSLAKNIPKRRNLAIKAGENMHFYHCRRELSAAWTELVHACKLERLILSPEAIQ